MIINYCILKIYLYLMINIYNISQKIFWKKRLLSKSMNLQIFYFYKYEIFFVILVFVDKITSNIKLNLINNKSNRQ